MWAIKENPNKIVFVSFSTFLGPHDSLKSFLKIISYFPSSKPANIKDNTLNF